MFFFYLLKWEPYKNMKRVCVCLTLHMDDIKGEPLKSNWHATWDGTHTTHTLSIMVKLKITHDSHFSIFNVWYNTQWHHITMAAAKNNLPPNLFDLLLFLDWKYCNLFGVKTTSYMPYGFKYWMFICS